MESLSQVILCLGCCIVEGWRGRVSLAAWQKIKELTLGQWRILEAMGSPLVVVGEAMAQDAKSALYIPFCLWGNL